jgi:xanthine dehydrogenase YagS FAD-binding subunit
MRLFAYSRPHSISEAIDRLSATTGEDGESPRLLAGGTDLLTLMKAGITAPRELIDIKRLPELDDVISITDDGGIRIGALASLSELEHHPLIHVPYAALSRSVAVAATRQLRNMATIGGNLLQRPRCWYFRDELVPCWLKGGDDCPAREGENQHHALFGKGLCVAVHPSDPATALLALDASVTLRGPDGERTLKLDAFFAEPAAGRRTETMIEANEILTSVNLPPPPARSGSAYLKAMDRNAWSFALVGVAAEVVLDGETIAGTRLVLGGVATIPWRARSAEDVPKGETPSENVFTRAAEVALSGATPLARNGYKIALLKPLISRALAEAADRAVRG